MNMHTLMGVLCGIIIGILIVVFFAKKGGNTDGKMRTEYDERQKIIRGTSYKIGFYSYIICAVIMMCVSMAEMNIPIQDDALWFTWLVVGAIPMCIHSIWKGAYWGLNNDKTKYIVLFCVATVVNILASVAAYVRGNMFLDGKLSTPFINVLCSILFIVIGATIIIKKIVDGKSVDEE